MDTRLNCKSGKWPVSSSSRSPSSSSGILLVKSASIPSPVSAACLLPRSLAPSPFSLASYYRGATGIMLVYDVTLARSFDNINKWLRNIDDHASDDVVKMLIGNKCDMDDRRCIDRSRGESLAREHAIPFLETSAKNNVNVEKAFFEMARLILKKSPVANGNGNTAGPVLDPARPRPGNSTNCLNCV